MKIDYSLYSLEYKHVPSSLRVGSLLRVTFKDGSIGYADCHPWPELGDKPVEQQLSLLRQLKPTALMRCSLEFSRLDAEARVKKRSLLASQKVPNSHFLITHLLAFQSADIDQMIATGHSYFKIKVGNHPSQEVARLVKLFAARAVKLCLDFNEKLSQESFLAFWRAIKPLHSLIDFVEDPFPFDAQAWKAVQEKHAVRFACDRQVLAGQYHPEAAAFWMLKPAVTSLEAFTYVPKEKVIVTSYLDHPLGQLSAAYVAAQIDPQGQHMHGLLTHYVYQPNVFSRSLSQQGPQFMIPEGYGFGYDAQLAELEWKTLL